MDKNDIRQFASNPNYTGPYPLRKIGTHVAGTENIIIIIILVVLGGLDVSVRRRCHNGRKGTCLIILTGGCWLAQLALTIHLHRTAVAIAGVIATSTTTATTAAGVIFCRDGHLRRPGAAGRLVLGTDNLHIALDDRQRLLLLVQMVRLWLQMAIPVALLPVVAEAGGRFRLLAEVHRRLRQIAVPDRGQAQAAQGVELRRYITHDGGQLWYTLWRRSSLECVYVCCTLNFKHILKKD
uniref:Uncharacterized protein n=1 Tax=Anopheles atroparvus TaxID=41427 RepID=A0A182JL70_ANOAO